MASTCFLSLLFVSLGSEVYDASEKYLEKGGPANAELARAVHPCAKAVLQTLLAMRALLFVLSLKWRWLTRVTIFLELTIYVAESFLPIDVGDLGFHSGGKMVVNLLHFILDYFYWWPSFICSILSFAIWHINRYLFYGESASEIMFHFVSSVGWYASSLFLVHLIITMVGFLYVEAEVLRGGNEKVLDNLEEGVVILNENYQSQILYYNKAAAGIDHKNYDQAEGSNDQETLNNMAVQKNPNLAVLLQQNTHKCFARVNKAIFEQTTADMSVAIQKLNSSNDFISISEIVNSDNASEDLQKSLFKIKKEGSTNINDQSVMPSQGTDQQPGQINSVKNQFVSMQVKKLIYSGRPAIAVYIRNKTKQVREKLIRLKRQEELQLLQQTESFTSTISHEMRTPTMTIIFFLQQLIKIMSGHPIDQAQISKGLKFCTLMLSQVEFMQSFIGDLIDLRELKYNSLQLTYEIFDFIALLKNLCQIFAPQLEMKRIKMRVFANDKLLDSEDDSSQAHSLFPRLVGDERRMKQVVINLVRNAMKFTHQGSIEIFASYKSAPDSTLEVKVCDTGVGIAPSDMPLLFTRFGKLQRTASMNSEGLGLGLTIVKQIVELIGGIVYVHSEGPNKGSTFGFRVQMESSGAGQDQAKQQEAYHCQQRAAQLQSSKKLNKVEETAKVISTSNAVRDQEIACSSLKIDQESLMQIRSAHMASPRMEDQSNCVEQMTLMSKEGQQEECADAVDLSEDDQWAGILCELSIDKMLSSGEQRKKADSQVLLIDDQLFLLLGMESQLQHEGIKCELRQGGQPALILLRALIDRNEPLFKVVILDYSMPEMDGPWTAVKIRQIYDRAGRQQPFIACCSSYSQTLIKDIVFGAGMNQIFDKKMTAEEIELIKQKLD